MIALHLPVWAWPLLRPRRAIRTMRRFERDAQESQRLLNGSWADQNTAESEQRHGRFELEGSDIVFISSKGQKEKVLRRRDIVLRTVNVDRFLTACNRALTTAREIEGA